METHVQWNIIFDQNDRIIYRSNLKELTFEEFLHVRKQGNNNLTQNKEEE